MHDAGWLVSVATYETPKPASTSDFGVLQLLSEPWFTSWKAARFKLAFDLFVSQVKELRRDLRQSRL
jgi:hypothetical protein